ncbi:MAG: methylated-DNA--[protein]-cysteine S-methyltransferase [Ignavibacteriaceae bacterium]
MKSSENIYYASATIAGIKFDIFSSRMGIKNIYLNKKASQLNTRGTTKLQPDDPFMFNVFTELKEYFNMRRTKFTPPLDIKGTKFQQKVWNELLKIPFGKTVSYKTIAKGIGNVKAVRAVGRANGANPVPIIIPCHRVIANDGKLGGYSAGEGIKEKLLEVEGCLSLELF